jgi:hypothetical protein
MIIDDKRKCKNRKTVNQMEFGTVFRNGNEYFLVTDEGSNEGFQFNEEDNTILCVNLTNGALVPICEDDLYEIVKAKVVIE